MPKNPSGFKPQLIVGMGIPSCGKSSVFRKLGELHQLKVFCEPEESKWPDAVSERETCGFFTAITWFRSQRVPNLFEAAQLRESGQTVLLDSYYDKLFKHWVGKKGMEWLIPSSDPYFRLTTDMADLDANILPNADVVVFFDLDNSTWKSFLEKRGRKLDQNAVFLQSFHTQTYFREASEQFCAVSGAKFVLFKQINSTVEQATEQLSEQLKLNGIRLS